MDRTETIEELQAENERLAVEINAYEQGIKNAYTGGGHIFRQIGINCYHHSCPHCHISLTTATYNAHTESCINKSEDERAKQKRIIESRRERAMEKDKEIARREMKWRKQTITENEQRIAELQNSNIGHNRPPTDEEE